jgi:pyruvate dehydrogenase E2 component (dihydrolipoamide acetyltransferase)
MGIGRIKEKAVVIDGGIRVRSMMTVTLSADHRVVDGATAAAFLKRVKDLMEAPREIS